MFLNRHHVVISDWVSKMEDRKFDPRADKTDNYNIWIGCFSIKCACVKSRNVLLVPGKVFWKCYLFVQTPTCSVYFWSWFNTFKHSWSRKCQDPHVLKYCLLISGRGACTPNKPNLRHMVYYITAENFRYTKGSSNKGNACIPALMITAWTQTI